MIGTTVSRYRIVSKLGSGGMGGFSLNWESMHLCVPDGRPGLAGRPVACCATSYNAAVTRSFRHKGLRRFCEAAIRTGIQPKHSARLRMQLAALDTALTIRDVDISGFRLHPLKGAESGRWSIWVDASWRLTFEFREGDVHILDYEDYH